MKRTLLVTLVSVCASLATAQSGKVAVGWACAKASPAHSIDIGDQAGHAYAIDQIKCTATKGEIAGVKEKEGTGTEFAEVSGNNSTGHGVYVETLSNGDTIHYTYTFTGTTKNKMTSGSNKWQTTAGTGKFKGIKASGTCTSTGNPDGSTAFTCNGTYSIPK